MKQNKHITPALLLPLCISPSPIGNFILKWDMRFEDSQFLKKHFYFTKVELFDAMQQDIIVIRVTPAEIATKEIRAVLFCFFYHMLH